jgi:TPR repeat protein
MKIKWYAASLMVFIMCAGVQLRAEPIHDGQESFESVKAKAENGDAEAQYVLAIWYFRGKDVPKNEDEAMKWFRKSVEQGCADAECYLAGIYLGGEGVATNEVEAFTLYKKAAEQGSAWGQALLGTMYEFGQGCSQDDSEAVKWLRKAADQEYAMAQFNLGVYYRDGKSVKQDFNEAVKWFSKAAKQELPQAQYNLGVLYLNGQGVTRDFETAVKLFQKAADCGMAEAQYNLGACYANGDGVAKDYIEAYKWVNLASAQGKQVAKSWLSNAELRMTPEQIIEAQRRSAQFVPKKREDSSISGDLILPTNPTATGTGFFITDDGYLISNFHVVKAAAKVQVVTSAGTFVARVVRVDAANDLALLKSDGQFAALPIVPSRKVVLGTTVATVGFPDPSLLGFSPKLAKGEIAALAGAADDARYFQISVPVQPGNSGGALMDEHGNVVGVVSAKLNAVAALVISGSLPENANYAIKSSFLLSFLESVPDVANKLKDPSTADRKFEDAVKSAQEATVMVLVK